MVYITLHLPFASREKWVCFWFFVDFIKAGAIRISLLHEISEDLNINPQGKLNDSDIGLQAMCESAKHLVSYTTKKINMYKEVVSKPIKI